MNDISYCTQTSILTIYIFISAIYLVFHTLWEILSITNILRVSEEMVQFIWKHLDSCFSKKVKFTHYRPGVA